MLTFISVTILFRICNLVRQSIVKLFIKISQWLNELFQRMICSRKVIMFLSKRKWLIKQRKWLLRKKNRLLGSKEILNFVVSLMRTLKVDFRITVKRLINIVLSSKTSSETLKKLKCTYKVLLETPRLPPLQNSNSI